MTPPEPLDARRLADSVDREMVSPWREVTQEAITAFAEITGDHQWIHVDVERARRAADEPWRESPDWTGTQLTYCAAVPNTVLKAFQDDPPSPEVRRIQCGRFLAPNAKPRCVGWTANVESVTPDGDGWNVGLTVSPRIDGIWYTNAKTVETWHVSAKGGARCDQCEFGGAFFVTR
jgi:hypothetical protein